MLVHLRHSWIIDDAPSPTAMLRCTTCGKVKVATAPRVRAEHFTEVVQSSVLADDGRQARYQNARGQGRR